jgi:hypothetical protein
MAGYRISLVLSLAVGFLSVVRRPAADEKSADSKVTEIRLERCGSSKAGPEDILTLRSDGTASYEGKKNVERIGRYHGKLAKHGLDDSFELLGEMYLRQRGKGYSTGKPTASVTNIKLTVVVNGKVDCVIEDHCPGTDSTLWALEMAIRGVGTDVQWKRVEEK